MKKFIEVHESNTRTSVLVSVDDIRTVIANPDQQLPDYGARIFFSNISSIGPNPAEVYTIEKYDMVKKKLLACDAGCIVS